jgi:molecular chaperone Hsp33
MMKKPDQLYRYLFEHYQVRGELVQLDETFHQMAAAQTYPEPVRQLLGELLVATSLLTATLKFSGAITVQLQGNGPVRLAVINGDHQQQLRGVARWEGEMPAEPTLKALVGDGQLIITISPEEGERYKDIVRHLGHYLKN